jgi:hypothetical protein
MGVSMPQGDSCEIISMGVDWITATTKDVDAGVRLLTWASELCTWSMRVGHERRGWGMAGFQGVQAGQVQLGQRNHEAIVRLSSDLAAIEWRRCYALADSVTRFDVQCTTRSSRPAATRIRRDLTAATRRARRSARAATVTSLRCTDGGFTVYLGKRSSNVFGRIYDKGVQSGDQRWQNCVRHEVEYKGDAARLAIREVAARRHDCDGVAACLQGFFSDRSGSLEWLDDTRSQLTIPRHRRDELSFFRWLRHSVRSGAQRVVECGRGAELLDALGLAINARGKLVVSDEPDVSLNGDEVMQCPRYVQ